MTETNKIATIQVKLEMLKSTEDIAAAGKRLPMLSAETVTAALDPDTNARLPWEQLWQTRNHEMLAGVTSEGIIAIEGGVYIPEGMRPNVNTVAAFIRDEMRGIFGADNVLACVGGRVNGKNVIVHFLVYPLNVRQLDVSKWVDSFSHQFREGIRNRFLVNLSDMLGVDYKSDVESVSNGHTPYLDHFPVVNNRNEDVNEVPYFTLAPGSQVMTDLPKDRMEAITNQTIKEFTIGVEKGNYIKLNSGDITLEDYKEYAKEYLRRNYPKMTGRDIGVVVRSVESAAAGFYVLDPLIDDPAVSDIKVVAPDKIRVKVSGARKTSNLHFISPQDYARFLDGLIIRYNLDRDRDIYTFTDSGTNRNFILRVNLTMQAINSGFPTLHIRKISKRKYTLPDLIRLGMMDETTANYLVWAARNASGLVFCGKGSSGKTTLMNTLIEYTPDDTSGLCIQESEEMFSYSKPEITFEHITDQYKLADLARNGLLTDIDYFIIGEIKGDEALDFIVAATTGNKAWCTVHGSSAAGGIDRLADYIMKAGGSKYDKPQALAMLANLQVLVFMKNFKVAEILEITGYDSVAKKLTFRQVLKRQDLLDNTTPVMSK